jgi:hypothetical protein
MECVIPALSFSLKCIALDNKQHRGQGKDPCRGGGGLVQCRAGECCPLGRLGVYCWLVGATRATCHSSPQMLDVRLSSRDFLLAGRLLALAIKVLKYLLCPSLKGSDVLCAFCII